MAERENGSVVKLVVDFPTGRTMAQYAFVHIWKEERDRLASIERMLDPITVHRLESNRHQSWLALLGSGCQRRFYR